MSTRPPGLGRNVEGGSRRSNEIEYAPYIPIELLSNIDLAGKEEDQGTVINCADYWSEWRFIVLLMSLMRLLHR